ncbi:MAG: TIM barrel protein [Terriglobia bacterium]
MIDRRAFIKSGMLSVAAANASLAAGETEHLRSPNQAVRGVKIACSLDLWTQGARASLARALDGVAGAGYQWTEGNASYLWDYRDRNDVLRRMLEQRQLGWITATYTANFPDMSQENLNISRTVQIARVLASLNSDFLTLASEWGNVPRQPLNYHRLSRNLSECGALVYEDTGLYCAYRFKEDEAADIRKIIATSDSRYTKFCFDTLFLMKLGIDPIPMIRTYGQRVIHIHLHDGTDQGGEWKEVPIGQGKLDLVGVLNALCEIRYDGWVTIQQEHVVRSPEQDAKQSRERVARILQASAPAGDSADSAENKRLAHRHEHEQMPTLRPERRETLHHIAVLGAAMSTCLGILRPVAFSPDSPEGESPMAGMSQAMMRDMKRPIPPLPPKDPNFKPLFFTEEEYGDVSALVDATIPAGEKPGALDARADEYADFMIWLDERHHAQVRGEVEAFRQLCFSRCQRRFSELTPNQVGEALAVLTEKSPGRARPNRRAKAFFNRIRRLTVHAYYTSPQGLLQDLGYKGNTYVSDFIGCTHPQHLGDWYQILSRTRGNEPRT